MNRQQRRAREREAKKAFSRYGIAPERELTPLFLQTRSLIQVLERRNNPHRASDAAQKSHNELALSLRSFPSPEPLACRKGCSYCCHNWVSATGAEILLIARCIKQNQRADFNAVMARIVAADDLTRGLNVDQRFEGRQACALLENDLCTVYEVRPNACRAFSSISLAACERSWNGSEDNIPVPEHFMILRGAHDQCLWAALRAVDLPCRSYELNHAVRIALETDDAEQRWLAREDVFAGVQPGSGDSFQKDLGDAFLDLLIAGARGEPLPAGPWT